MGERSDRGRSLKEIFVYVEGGGKGSSAGNLRVSLQNGLFNDIRSRAAARGIKLQFVACTDRGTTIKQFSHSVRTKSHISLLLVDSEGPVRTSVTQHLRVDYKDEIPGEERQYHLMVQTMESWFVADAEALQRYFGPNATIRNLPLQGSVEDIPKERLYTLLHEVAKSGGRAGYRKGTDQAELLLLIDPDKVAERSPHFHRFRQTLRELTEVAG